MYKVCSKNNSVYTEGVARTCQPYWENLRDQCGQICWYVCPYPGFGYYCISWAPGNGVNNLLSWLLEAWTQQWPMISEAGVLEPHWHIVEQSSSEFEVHMIHWEVLLNCRSWLSKSGWSPRCCVSNKVVSDADAAGPQNIPWVAKQRKECKGYRDGNVGCPSYVQPLTLKGPGR